MLRILCGMKPGGFDCATWAKVDEAIKVYLLIV